MTTDLSTPSSKKRTMTDPYRILEATEASHPAQPAGAQGGMVRPVLWLLLMVGAVLNMVTSSIVTNVFVGIGFGLVTLAFAAALIAHHYRHRR